MAKRLSTPAEVIRAPHWQTLVLRAEDALAERRVTADGIRAVDRWLAHVERSGGTAPTVEVILGFFAGTVSSTPIGKLARALHAIDPCHPHLPALAQALELRSRAYRPARPVRARSRTPTVSVERDSLPAAWGEALGAMARGERRGSRAPAPAIVRTIEMKLRQLASSAAAEGHPIDLSIPALSAYVQAMIARGLASSTIASTLGKLRTFAIYTGAPSVIVAAIAAEQRLHTRRAPREGKHKERFLLKSGLTLEDVARCARHFHERARVAPHIVERHLCWMRAALFAFVLCRALRPLDVHKLVIGEHLRRDTEGWSLHARTRKNAYRVVGRMWDICTPYLDGAILLGADESRLWEMYRAAEGRPLLADRQGMALSRNWATEQSRRYLGIGIGILRTLWHDHCATVGTARAVETALAICLQHHPRTRRHYRTRMSARSVVAQAQDLVDSIASELSS